ncbi:hypothetical protein B0J12DRAFT_681740 [Macrophomina phaseolina]|uniref:Secreted protein n=1 Tax=Macrophomina phaseolina TaxID=35725 RepID=A0ABQ8FZ06_9PEZI|nr:hypothetical protein B0J12DRAFT_681740 [Macrophomina phaseolina]
MWLLIISAGVNRAALFVFIIPSCSAVRVGCVSATLWCGDGPYETDRHLGLRRLRSGPCVWESHGGADQGGERPGSNS